MPASTARNTEAGIKPEAKTYSIDTALGIMEITFKAYDEVAHKVIKEGAKPGETIKIMFDLSDEHNDVDLLSDGSTFNYAIESIASYLNCWICGTIHSHSPRQLGFNLQPYGNLVTDYLGRNKRSAVRKNLPKLARDVEQRMELDKNRR